MIETNNPLNEVKAAVSEIKGLNLYDNLLSIAVKQTAARKVKAESVFSAELHYEKIAVSAAVIKSVLTSYLHEIEEPGFMVPSFRGRVLLAELKYNPADFTEVLKDLTKPQAPIKPQAPVKPADYDKADDKIKADYDKALKDYDKALNEFNRALNDYNTETAKYEAVIKERAAGLFRHNNRVFVFSENPLKEGLKPETVKVYLFSSLMLEAGKFSDNMLSGDNGISAAALLLQAVGVDTYINNVKSAIGYDYKLSDKETAFIAGYAGVSLSERGEILLLRARNEAGAVLSDEEYEKAVKAAAKSIYQHLKAGGLTTAKKDRVIPEIIIELKKRY